MVRSLPRGRRAGIGAVGAIAVAVGLTACQTPLGQVGFDNTNTSSNAAETVLDATNVGTVVATFDTDLTGYGTVTNLGEPVFSANGNIIVTTDDQVVSVRTDGTVAWNTVIPDAHPEIDAPHIISAYGGSTTVDVLVDAKVQGAGPSYVGGSVVKLDKETGALTSSRDTLRPAAPLGFANNGLVITGEVTDHAVYGLGRTVTVDVAGSGRRIVRNAVGSAQKPAVSGDRVVVAIGDSLYQWSTPCATGTVCDETSAAVTAVPSATRPVLVDTTVYITSRTDRTLYAIGADGAVLWTGGVGNQPADASASVAAGKVFVGNTTGIFYGFPFDGCGSPTCSYTYINSFVDQISTAPTLANGLAYVMVSGGLRIARSDCTLVENCSPKKSITLNGPILGSSQQVLVKDGRFYVLTNDGHLRAWGLPA